MLTRAQRVVANCAKEIPSFIPVLKDIEEELAYSPTNGNQMANAIWVLKKTEEALEASLKAVRDTRRNADAKFCTLCAAAEQKNFKTDFATVTPSPSFYIAFPNAPGKEGYEQFVKGLPPELVRPYYPGIEKALAEEIAKGNQPPYGLSLTGLTSSYGTRVLSKKDLA